MPFYRRLGTLPPKRHTLLRKEPGFRGEGLYYEEVVTLAGFGRAYSIAYPLRPPTRVRKIEAAGTVPVASSTLLMRQKRGPRSPSHACGPDFVT